jgi:hypothetical protein
MRTLISDPTTAILIKLPLALLVFLVIAYAGTVNRRIAGVLFTFPILNGVAIVTSSDPVRVADAIYPLVMFNCVLFALLISFPRLLPVGSWPHNIRILARVSASSVAWLAGAYLITDRRDALPGAAPLLIVSMIAALAFIFLSWRPQPIEATKPRRHAAAFLSFWGNATGLWRIALFVIVYACLSVASHAALDEKWVGMASALPLPGLFALATLIDEAERSAAVTLTPLRDTLFLGPLLVIPFNWSFAHALTAMLPQHAIVLRYVLLLALWAIAALAVVLIVPLIAKYFDRRS